MTSRSHILKKIIESLENEQYRHMLYWHDRDNKEFFIKFVHMNNKEFKNADYLELFKDLDKLSSNYEKYLKEEKYDHNCKVRCKSNLKKLCGKDNNKALTLMEKNCKGKSIQLRKYKLNDDSMLDVNNLTKGGDMTKRCNVNGFSGRETVQRIPYIKGKLKIESLSNEQSHCLCLSKLNAINVYIDIPIGVTSASNASPVGPTMLYGYCATENRIGNVMNAIPQIDPSTLYEHEKQAYEYDVALPAMPVDYRALYGVRSCSSIEENIKCEPMEYNELLAPKIQGNVAIQNFATLPAMSIENPPLHGFVHCFNNEENDKCKSMEYSDLLVEDIQANMEIQNIEEFQDTDVETNNWSQLVPSSPLDVKGISNDPFCEYYTDYRPDVDKPLQLDNDPLLSSTSTNWSDGNVYLPSDTEDFYSFENLSSIDGD